MSSASCFDGGGAPLVYIFTSLTLGDVACLACASRAINTFQKASWLLWQALLDRDAPEEEVARVAAKVRDKQVAAVWRGALKGYVRRLACARHKSEAKVLQAALKRLVSAHSDAGAFFAGRGIDSHGYVVCATAPPPEGCAAALEEAWLEGTPDDSELQRDSIASVIVRQAPQLLREGVPRPGKWSRPKGLFEVLALACAPTGVVDRVFEKLAASPCPPEGLLVGLLEGIRCHRNYLVQKLLTELRPASWHQDPRPLAMACYAKNCAAVRTLLSLGADANARCLEDAFAFPEDDTFWPGQRCRVPTTPAALAVRGRAYLPPEVWLAAPAIVMELLAARAAMSEQEPLDALLAQGPRITRSYEVMLRHRDAGDAAWLAAWTALTEAGARLQGGLPLHAAARPQYVGQLLDQGLLSPGALVARDADGVSALVRLAVRAVSCPGYSFVYSWHKLFWRLLTELGSAASLVDIVPTSAYHGVEDIRAITCAPCPVLALAVKWHDGILVKRCMEEADQTVIDICTDWRGTQLAMDWPQYDSLIYTVAFVGRGCSVLAALRRGCRFRRNDLAFLHGDVGRELGPVAALASVAARHAEGFAPLYWICWGCRSLNGANQDPAFAKVCRRCDLQYHDNAEAEAAVLGDAAVALLCSELDDPTRLVVLDGVAGGLAAMEALSAQGVMSHCGVPSAWWAPVRRWLREQRSREAARASEGGNWAAEEFLLPGGVCRCRAEESKPHR